MDRKGRIEALADTTMPSVPLLEIAGDGRVLIEHHQGVTQYSTESVCFKVKFGTVCVIGHELVISKMTADQLVICGRILSVTLHRGCKG